MKLSKVIKKRVMGKITRKDGGYLWIVTFLDHDNGKLSENQANSCRTPLVPVPQGCGLGFQLFVHIVSLCAHSSVHFMIRKHNCHCIFVATKHQKGEAAL